VSAYAGSRHLDAYAHTVAYAYTLTNAHTVAAAVVHSSCLMA
jgi:hypothetical protein